MSACPTCGKPVDALRARNVKVRGIQVVAYCSPECLAAAGDSTATAVPRPATPAQVAPDSGPVIEIRYEPASGVVTSAKDERQPTPVPKAPKDDKPEAKAADTKPDDKKADTKADDKKADKAESRRDRKTSDRRPILKIVEEPGAAPKDVKAPKGTPAPAKPPAKEPDPVSPTKLPEAALEPGKRRATKVTLDRDNANVDQAEDWLDDEPANVGAVRAGTDVGDRPASGGGKRALITLLVLGLLAAGGILAYKFLYVGKGNAAKVTPDKNASLTLGSAGSGSQVVETPADAAPAVAPDKRAIEVLRDLIDDKDSPRLQRLAAAALARTHDPQAIERLATALQRDKLEPAGRYEVAYALARAGDKRGLEALVGALSAPRRDDKISVGRLLVQLGDTRGINALVPYLELPQHRLGIAEWLARLGEPRAIKALEQIRADDKASPDDKARAAIALVHSGKTGINEELRALLPDPRFNVFAAEALATRRDEAARPVLVKQLDVTSLRVGAARALRHLAPEGDHGAEVKRLLAALDDPNKQRDTEQVTLAEAILLLVGPASWAERQ